MTQLLVELKELAKSNPVLSEEKMRKHTERLDYMRGFYDLKAPDAPRKQAAMFNGFSVSLLYTASILKMYRSLTIKLDKAIKAAEEDQL